MSRTENERAFRALEPLGDQGIVRLETGGRARSGADIWMLGRKLEQWKRLSEGAMEIVRTRDSGTLQYEVFFNEDESEAVVFERYRDAGAAIEHFSNISHLMGPLLGTASVTAQCWERRTRR